MRIESGKFGDGETIPMECVYPGCGGGNLSPELAWSGAPEGTKSFALLCHDPDAPTGTGFYHWTMWNIPASATGLEAGAGARGAASAPAGSAVGFTDYGEVGYQGPCPPPGPAHRYNFTLYALDVEKLEGLNEHTTGAKLRFMIRNNTLAEARLTGTYASG